MWRTSSGNVCLWWQAFRGGSVSCWLVVWWLLATFLSYISIPFYPCLCSILWNSGSLLKHMIIGTWSEAEARSRFFNLFPLCILCLTWILLDAVTICYNAVVDSFCFMLFPRCSWRSTTMTRWSQSCWKPLRSLAPESQSRCSIFVVCWKISSGVFLWASFAHMGHYGTSNDFGIQYIQYTHIHP